MTSPIVVKPGKSLCVWGGDSSGYVAVIAKDNGDNTYTPLSISDGSIKSHRFDNTTTQDVNLVVSVEWAMGYRIYIANGSPAIENEDSDKDPFVTEEELEISSESGHFINREGTVATNSAFSISAPFTLKKGDGIVITCSGYESNVAILSKYQSGTYTPIIVSEDSSLHTWKYVHAGDDTQFACSFLTANGLTIKKVVNEQVSIIANSLADEPLLNSATQMIVAGIPVMGIIGDSLSSGYTIPEDGPAAVNTHYEFAWWQVLKRDSGMDYKYFARGGVSTRSWFTVEVGYPKASLPENKCCAYVIALGVNDEYDYGLDYIGTAADINMADPSLNADTYFGNYGKIIQMMTALVPKAKFFLLTIPRTSGNIPAYNTAIRNIASMFSNAYLVDIAADYMGVFNSGFLQDHFFSAHYSAAGYQYIGKIFEKAIGDTIMANAVDFRYIQFALDE